MYELGYLEQGKTDIIRIKRYIAKESGSQEMAGFKAYLAFLSF